MNGLGRLTVAGLLLALPGCAGNGMGAVGDILGGVLGQAGGVGAPQQGQLSAEIQSLDTRRQVIHVRTQSGQTGAVQYDQNTTVVYRQQQYPVTALEPGDVVAMQVQQTSQNQLYTHRIDVQQSVQERTGQTAGAQLRQVSGRVAQIDHQRRFFDLQTQQGTFTVLLPANAGPATLDYFHRMRIGETVMLEGTVTGTGRIDLYRFI